MPFYSSSFGLLARLFEEAGAPSPLAEVSQAGRPSRPPASSWLRPSPCAKARRSAARARSWQLIRTRTLRNSGGRNIPREARVGCEHRRDLLLQVGRQIDLGGG